MSETDVPQCNIVHSRSKSTNQLERSCQQSERGNPSKRTAFIGLLQAPTLASPHPFHLPKQCFESLIQTACAVNCSRQHKGIRATV